MWRVSFTFRTSHFINDGISPLFHQLVCFCWCCIDLRPAGPKRQMRRLLKKEVSLDTYTWQKKYGHLTSSVMMAQVDERLKRRFSVSASMEEISKIAEMKTLASQASLGPEQAALAQSQHFDQLEALWNKRSPPRRRNNTVNFCFGFITYNIFHR